METIKEFLVSDIYLDIIKELGVDNFNQDVQSVEVEELKNLITELGRIEKNVVYKIGLIDGMKEKNKCI